MSKNMMKKTLLGFLVVAICSVTIYGITRSDSPPSGS